MSNITELPPANLSEMEQGLVEFKENLETIIEYNQMAAKIMKCKYDALLEEGFDAEQALQLCRL